MAKPIPEMPSSVFVALVGRPNVGKSSLTNYLVGEKVAIVTKKPQTTRSRITGVITKGPVQYVLMDTPGIHAARNKLDARMTQTAAASLKDVDVTMMLFEPAGEFTDAELTMVKALQKGGPAIAVINKVDLLDSFAALEARKKQLEEFGCFDHIVTISAKDGTGCDELFAMLKLRNLRSYRQCLCQLPSLPPPWRKQILRCFGALTLTIRKNDHESFSFFDGKLFVYSCYS